VFRGSATFPAVPASCLLRIRDIFPQDGTTPAGLRFDHMHLRAHECRERAVEAWELAQQAKRPSTKNAFERAADYWVALAERVELEERKSIPLARTVIHSDRMPIVSNTYSALARPCFLVWCP
jgi:hypothetical protein